MPRSSQTSVLRYPLTTILGTEANVRVLRELAQHGGQLSAPLIAARTRLARSNVWVGLTALVEAGVVSEAGAGRTRLYALRSGHPLAAAISALFERENDRFERILDSVREAARSREPGVLAVWIYGSVARGEDRPTSDLDIAVVTTEDRRGAIIDPMKEALHVSGEALGFRPSIVGITEQDVVRNVRDATPWWIEVARDALALLGPRPDELARQLSLRARKRGAA